jgi:chemotaxis response regulator CheB
LAVATIKNGIRQAAAPEQYRVMVVDNSLAIRGLLSRALGTDPAIRSGIREQRKSALEELHRGRCHPHIEMPVMDGLTAFRG